MTTPSIFARHIDQPAGTRHRCVLLDERHLRCLDCDHTLVIPSGVTTTSTSLRDLPNLHDPNGCTRHPGNRSATCGPCRSERIAIPDGQQKPDRRPPAADPSDDYRQARQQLATRHTQETAATPTVGSGSASGSAPAAEESDTTGSPS